MVDQYENYGDEIKESILNAATGDQPTLDDSLGFSPYIESIKEFLINPSTKPPLTLSIEGSWGSGKSSFMLQLQENLKKNKEYTVRFNAWRHDKEDTMWAAFALEFIRQLSKDLTLFQRLRAEYKLFKSRIRWTNKRENILQILAILIFLILYLAFFYFKGFDWINSFPIQFMILSYLGASYTFYKAIESFVLDLKNFLGTSLYANLKKCIKTPNYENRTTFIEEFHEDFKNIVECYAEGKKVFVFIDDLDRCEVPKAADLMQALNLMISNDPHLIFIIGMDRLKVASGLAVKHERLIPYLNKNRKNTEYMMINHIDSFNGLEYGYEFLEKFIQLPFLVPNPNKLSLNNFLGELSDIKKVKSTELEPKKFWNKVNESFEKIRDPLRILKNKEKIQTEKNSTQSSINNQSEATSQEKQRKFIEKLRIEVTSSDSQTVHDIILMVSSTLDYNPRRIKQFINLFRLKTFIASETGLFCVFEDSSYKGEFTLEKLGKFVAITLKWPLIVSDLNENQNLFDELQNFAVGISNSNTELSYEAKRWICEPKLIDLLVYGCLDVSDGSVDPQGEKKYSLAGLNINKLLQVSPKLVRPDEILNNEVEVVKDTAKEIPSSKILEEENYIQQINIKKMLKELKEKDEIIFRKSKGTPTEDIARVVSREVNKWKIGNQEEMAQSIDSLASILKMKITDTSENEYILNKVEALKNEKDLTKQYELLLFVISQIPTMQITSEQELNRKPNKLDYVHNKTASIEDIMYQKLNNINSDISKVKLNSADVVSNLKTIKEELEKLNEIKDLNIFSIEKLDPNQAEKLNSLNRNILDRLDEVKILIDNLPKNEDTQEFCERLNELKQSKSDMLLQKSSAVVSLIGFAIQILQYNPR